MLTKLWAIFLRWWPWQWKPHLSRDQEIAGYQKDAESSKAEADRAQREAKELLATVSKQRDENQKLLQKTLPGMDLGDGATLIKVSVVLVWLFLAGGAGLTVLITVFLGREVPNMAVVERAIALVGVAAAAIIGTVLSSKKDGGQ